MQITFDPHNARDRAAIAFMLGTTAQPETAPAQPDTAPAQPDTAPAQPDTATEQPDTAPAQTAEPDTAPAHPSGDTDCHGKRWYVRAADLAVIAQILKK